MKITYIKYEHYYLPDLVVSEEEPATYGRFGRMQLKYLKEHRTINRFICNTLGHCAVIRV